MSGTIVQRLELLAARAPDKVFLALYQRDQIHQITYRDIYWHSHCFAQRLAAKSISSGETVAIMLRHSPELYYAFLGTMMLGAIPTLMPDLTQNRTSSTFGRRIVTCSTYRKSLRLLPTRN